MHSYTFQHDYSEDTIPQILQLSTVQKTPSSSVFPSILPIWMPGYISPEKQKLMTEIHTYICRIKKQTTCSRGLFKMLHKMLKDSLFHGTHFINTYIRNPHYTLSWHSCNIHTHLVSLTPASIFTHTYGQLSSLFPLWILPKIMNAFLISSTCAICPPMLPSLLSSPLQDTVKCTVKTLNCVICSCPLLLTLPLAHIFCSSFCRQAPSLNDLFWRYQLTPIHNRKKKYILFCM